MSRPRILIPIPTSFDQEYNAKSWPEYATAIAEAARQLEALVAEAAGVLLPGSGADVDPARYGHDRTPASAPPDPLREATDRVLLEGAEQRGKPLFGICLGLQSMNVYYGGTLIQDVRPVPVNHRAGRSVQVAHTAQIANDSLLGACLSRSDDVVPLDEAYTRLPVNSSHHQAVATPGDGLRVVARCPDDGVIEALERSTPAQWLLGVQWHPERTLQVSSASRALFAGFLRACSSSWQA